MDCRLHIGHRLLVGGCWFSVGGYMLVDFRLCVEYVLMLVVGCVACCCWSSAVACVSGVGLMMRIG